VKHRFEAEGGGDIVAKLLVHEARPLLPTSVPPQLTSQPPALPKHAALQEPSALGAGAPGAAALPLPKGACWGSGPGLVALPT
jgi:hypothetical protein